MTDSRIPGARGMMLLAALSAGAFLPFAWRAFNIDDPLFIWCARHIVRHPLDPYGFAVNWFGTEMPMWEVMRNPPAASYYLSLFGALFGWSEPALHSAMMLAAVGCVLGTAFLARHFGSSGFLAGLLLLSTPGFFLSGTTVMCDALMLAFLVWSAWAWASGIDEGRSGRLIVAGILLAAAALTKFNALVAVPAFLLYARKQLRAVQLSVLAIPVAALVGYLVAASARYGGSLFDALAMASAGEYSGDLGTRLVVCLTFLGGCCITVLFLAPLHWPRRWVLAGLGGAALLTGVFVMAGGLTLKGLDLGAPLPAAQVVVFGAAGALAVLLCAVFWRSSDPAAWLVVPWIGVTLLFAVFAAWTVSGRYLLPVAPPLAVCAVRMLDRRGKPPARLPLTLAVLLSAAVSLAVAKADAALADTARRAATTIVETYGPAVWFQGHWGFQYYMEERGAKPLDAQSSRVSPGEIIAIPANNTNTFQVDRRFVRLRETLEFQTFYPVFTMNKEVKAGFYASVWGPLPFAAGAISPEKYYILSIVSP